MSILGAQRRLAEQSSGHRSCDPDMHCVPKSLKRKLSVRRELEVGREALERQGLTAGDVPAEWHDDRNLAGREGDESRYRSDSLDPQSRRPELKDVRPKVALLSLAVPLEFAVGWLQLPDLRK